MSLQLSGSGVVTGLTSINTDVSDTEIGYLDGVTSALQSQLGSKLPIAGGKILQIVRATDSTERTTTSTSFVDASISVTITPQRSDSAIILIWSAYASTSASGVYVFRRITDNSNNAISGAQEHAMGTSLGGLAFIATTAIAYATPATTSATTYKGRFQVNSGTGTLQNQVQTGQMYAIEVSA
jgi:hypothetical protein